MWAAGETRKAWKALDHQLLRCDPTAKRNETMSMHDFFLCILFVCIIRFWDIAVTTTRIDKPKPSKGWVELGLHLGTPAFSHGFSHGFSAC